MANSSDTKQQDIPDLTDSPNEWLGNSPSAGTWSPPSGVNPEAALPIADLEQWLRGTFERELPGTLQKAFTYGSADLEVMAGAMGQLLPQLDHQQSLEAAIAFYALGKVARLFGALREGRTPDPDSWYDMHIYALMGLKVQQTGRWL